MTYVYLDDGFPEHEKVSDAGGDAAWLYVCGICYVNRNLTGGRIPKSTVARLTDRKRPMALAAKLVDVNLWEDDGSHFVIHGYAERNATAEKKRKAAIEKAKKAAEARWHPDAPGMPQASAEHESSNASASTEQCETMPPVRARTGVPNSPTPQLPDSRGGSSPSEERLALTTLSAPATPKRKDALFEAVAEATGVDWRSELTPTARKTLNTAVGELRSIDADPTEVGQRANRYRRRYEKAPTAMALAKHWPQLAHDDRVENAPRPSRAQESLARLAANGEFG